MGFSFVTGILVTALLLLVEHWYPWKRRPSDLARYAMGSGAILVGLSIWLGETGMWSIMARILAFYLVGGLSTAGAYYNDRLGNLEQRLRLYDECNQRG